MLNFSNAGNSAVTWAYIIFIIEMRKMSFGKVKLPA